MDSVQDFLRWLAEWRRGYFLKTCVAPLVLVGLAIVFDAFKKGIPPLETISVILAMVGYPWGFLGPLLFLANSLQYAYASSRGLFRKFSLMVLAVAGAVYFLLQLADGWPAAKGFGGLLVLFFAVTLFSLAFGGAALLASLVARESEPVHKVAEHLQGGNLPEALLYADLTSRRGPNDRANLRSVMAQLFRGEHFAEALALADVMTAAEPNDVDSWRAKADISFYAGKVDESMEAFDQAMRLAPKNADIHYDRGVKLARDPKTHAQALKDYSRAIELDSRDARFWANRASLLQQMGRHESALADAAKAIALNPNDRVAARVGYLCAKELGREEEMGKWSERVESSGASEEADGESVGEEHRTCFPLLCQMGNDGNQSLANLSPGRAQREYLKVVYYLIGKGLVDQYLLGKAFLGLLTVESQKPAGESALHALLDGPPSGGFGGVMAPIGHLHGACVLIFERGMLSPGDGALYEALRAFRSGKGPCPQPVMEPWDLSQAKAESFPVLHIPSSTVAVVLRPSAPPTLSPELAGMELDIRVPGLSKD